MGPPTTNSILRRPNPIANSTAVAAVTSAAGPSTMASSSSTSRRPKETSFEMSGIEKLKDATRLKAPLATHDENSYDEEDDENVDEHNLHTEATASELAALRINANNHGDTNGRATRSARVKG